MGKLASRLKSQCSRVECALRLFFTCFIRWNRSARSGFRQGKNLTRIDLVRVADVVAVGAVDQGELGTLAIGAARDPPQAVAGLDYIAPNGGYCDLGRSL